MRATGLNRPLKQNILRRDINMAVAMQNRVGEVHKTNEGYEIKIIDYIQSSKVLIEFQDEFHSQKWTQYDYCLKGSVKNPFHRTVYGVGFLG